MRGLSAIEWYILDGASFPDPCDEETDCAEFSEEQKGAEARLVARGLVRCVPCVFDPADDHPALTSAGKMLLSLGASFVVGGVP